MLGKVKAEKYLLRITQEQKRAYELCAAAEGMKLSQWIREACDFKAAASGRLTTPLSSGGLRTSSAHRCTRRVAPGQFCKDCGRTH